MILTASALGTLEIEWTYGVLARGFHAVPIRSAGEIWSGVSDSMEILLSDDGFASTF